MIVQYPYRAVIRGEEHIVQGWRGRKLLTNKGSYLVGHLYGEWRIQDCRLLEVALIQPGPEGGWLLNGQPLASLSSLAGGLRLDGIPYDETLRVYKDRICAVAWIQAARPLNVTKSLDSVLKSWKRASLPAANSAERPRLLRENEWSELAGSLSRIAFDATFFKEWRMIWLTEFRATGHARPITPEEKKLARLSQELAQEKERRRKAEAAASDTLQEALSKWMKFDPPGMSPATKARIEKAVKIYVTDPDKRSLAKIAAEFKVTRKTVSVWFKTFEKETGYRVVRHVQHVSVRAQFEAASSETEDDDAEEWQ